MDYAASGDQGRKFLRLKPDTHLTAQKSGSSGYRTQAECFASLLYSRLVFDRLRDFSAGQESRCRGAHGWARAARSAIHVVIPLTQKIPQPIKSLSDLAQQLMKRSASKNPGPISGLSLLRCTKTRFGLKVARQDVFKDRPSGRATLYYRKYCDRNGFIMRLAGSSCRRIFLKKSSRLPNACRA